MSKKGGMAIGESTQSQVSVIENYFIFHFIVPTTKTKTNFPGLPAPNLHLCWPSPLPQLSGGRKVTLCTVPSDCIGSWICLRIQFHRTALQQSRVPSSACQKSLAGSADPSWWQQWLKDPSPPQRPDPGKAGASYAA